jgi:hypothetical protein
VVERVDDEAGLEPVAPRRVSRGDEAQEEEVGEAPGGLRAGERPEGPLPFPERGQLGPVVAGERDQRREIGRQPAHRRELVLGEGDLLAQRDPEVGGEPRPRLRLACPGLVEPQLREPHRRLQAQDVALGHLADVLRELLLGPLQGAVEPVRHLVEEALGVAREQEPLVDLGHLERDVGALHARLGLARSQAVRGGLAPQRDLPERVEGLDGGELADEDRGQIAEAQVAVLVLARFHGGPGDQRRDHRRADAAREGDERAARRVDLAALGPDRLLLGPRRGDLRVLGQRGPDCAPSIELPPQRRRAGRHRECEHDEG